MVYSRLLETHPLLTKGSSAGAVMLCADVTQQAMERRQAIETRDATDGWDASRSARLCAFYGCVQTPFVHNWFATLERLFGAVTPASNLPLFVGKVLLDQAIGPPLVLGAFCVAQPLMHALQIGRGWSVGLEDGAAMLQRDWLHMVTTGWQLWVPCTFVIFGTVPLKFRILSMNMVSFCWSTFVSKMGGSGRMDSERGTPTQSSSGDLPEA